MRNKEAGESQNQHQDKQRQADAAQNNARHRHAAAALGFGDDAEDQPRDPHKNGGITREKNRNGQNPENQGSYRQAVVFPVGNSRVRMS